MDELISVRQRKNTPGVYRLDHDSGRHDDQAIALALGAHYLLDADGGAGAWIRWAREKAIAAGAIIINGQITGVPEPRPRAALAPAPRQPEPAKEPELVGVVLDAATARKRARDELYRSTPDAIALRFMNGG